MKYLAGFDELNRLIKTFTKEEKAKAKEEFEDFLIEYYLLGFSEVCEDLGVSGNAPLHDFLKVSYDGKTVADKIEEYLEEGDTESLKRLAESQYHQAYNMGGHEASILTDSYKTWVTIGDEKVRLTHSFLEGVKIPTEEYFHSVSGDKALYPGGFETAEENANCRCICKYTRD